MGLDKAGYATSGTYGPSLIKTIERLNLQDIDRQVMEQMKTEGKSFGVETNPQQKQIPTATAHSRVVIPCQ